MINLCSIQPPPKTAGHVPKRETTRNIISHFETMSIEAEGAKRV
jgi:hypothetical protein